MTLILKNSGISYQDSNVTQSIVTLNADKSPYFPGTFTDLSISGSGYMTNVSSSVSLSNTTKNKRTLTFTKEKLQLNQIGFVFAFAGNSAPSGYLFCDGSAISRTTYAKLFAVIGTTYGSGNGSTTFNLPNLIDKFIQGNATPGTVKSAGLPNITGSFFGEKKGIYVYSYSGAFYKGSSSGYQGVGDSDWDNNQSMFDASRSSSIYGNSTTVQPPALTMKYIIAYE